MSLSVVKTNVAVDYTKPNKINTTKNGIVYGRTIGIQMDEINWKYKEGLRYLMAQTFGLTVSDIIDA